MNMPIFLAAPRKRREKTTKSLIWKIRPTAVGKSWGEEGVAIQFSGVFL